MLSKYDCGIFEKICNYIGWRHRWRHRYCFEARNWEKSTPPLIEHEGNVVWTFPMVWWYNLMIGYDWQWLEVCHLLPVYFTDRNVFCWLSSTPLKTSEQNIFMKNSFQILNQRPQISLSANFQNFSTILKFLLKLGPIFWGTRSRPKQHVPPVSHLSRWKVPNTGDHFQLIAYTSMTSR